MKRNIISLTIVFFIFVTMLCGCDYIAIDRISFDNGQLGQALSPDLTGVKFTGLNFSGMKSESEIELYKVTQRNYACDGNEVKVMADYCKLPYEDVKFDFDDNTADYKGTSKSNFSFLRGYRLVYQKYIPPHENWHEVTQTKEELIKESLEIIDDIPFVENERIEGYVQVSMGGEAIEKVEEGSVPCYYLRSYEFSPIINGHTVVGAGKITVGFTRKGFAQLIVNYYDYEPIGKYEIISPEEAWEQINNPQYVVGHDRDFPVRNVTRMDIESCDLVYVNACNSGYNIIQPYYYVKGTVYSHYFDRDWEDTFTMYIPALKN